MGFVLSILYFLIYYLTPTYLFGSLAQYHIELILAVLLLLVSLPSLIGSFLFKTPQALALVGMSFAVFLSILFGLHWMGGAVTAFLGFIPNIYAFFLVCLHCNSRTRMRAVILVMLFTSVFVVAKGANDLRHGAATTIPPTLKTGEMDRPTWDLDHPFLLAMGNGSGGWLVRLRGLGEIHDPNDLGQLMVCLIPLLFVFWRPRNRVLSLVTVILPVCVLLAGIYLTHSRGALLALMVVVVVAARRRIGTVPALVLGGALVAAALALHFTGGREISASAGEDRTSLWGMGLQMVKSHPAFGVGMGQFNQYAGLTAHNSVVVCVAELGLFGFFFWCLYLFSTARSVYLIASPEKVNEAAVSEAGESQPLSKGWKGRELDKSETNHLGTCLLASLAGFLAAGWFLSRAFVLTWFLLGGLIEVVYESARRQGMVAPRLPMGRYLYYSLLLVIGLLLFVYLQLRVLNLLH